MFATRLHRATELGRRARPGVAGPGRLIRSGGNIYFLSKIFSSDGKSFQFAAGSMTGMTQEEYAEMMINGGRSVEGNHYKGERENG